MSCAKGPVTQTEKALNVDIEILSSAMIIGLLGAGHCIGMCGGIGSALTFAISKDDSSQRLAVIAAYNIGRIASYVLIGTIAAGIAELIQALGFPYFRFISAVLMILMGLYLSGIWRALSWLEKVGHYLWRFIQPLAARLMPVKSFRQALFLGTLWGWLPCGLVYTALAFSASQASAAQGALVMLLFGLGTVPAVVSGSLVAGAFKSLIQGRGFRYLSSMAMILFGIWTIYSALGHTGHHQHGNLTNGAVETHSPVQHH